MTADHTDAAEDEMLDRLDAGLPVASPEEQAARAPYEQLSARLRELPVDREPPDGMRERLRERWQAESAAQAAARRRRRGRAIGAGLGALAVAVAAVLLLMPGDRPGGPHVELTVRPPAGAILRGSDEVAAVGSVLELRGRRGAAHTELRVYHGLALIARCPQDPRCRGLALDLTVDAPGIYRIVWMSGAKPQPAHSEGYDADVRAAHGLATVVELVSSIDVGL